MVHFREARFPKGKGAAGSFDSDLNPFYFLLA
jgi:hypothetical protein